MQRRWSGQSQGLAWVLAGSLALAAGAARAAVPEGSPQQVAPRSAAPRAQAASSASEERSQTRPRPAWKQLWSVPVGSTEGDHKDEIGAGQIAMRGSMIVVASRGTPNQSDAQDGVWVVNGSDDVLDSARLVRRIPSPTAPSLRQQKGGAELAGATDAIGVALDGDVVVFGSYGGIVTKVRLDGVEDWRFTAWPERTHPGLPALIDVNHDRKRDVVVPVIPFESCPFEQVQQEKCGPGWVTLAIALDGESGQELWRTPRRKAPCQQMMLGYEPDLPALLASCATTFNDQPWSRAGSVLNLLDGTPRSNTGIEESGLGLVALGLAEPRARYQGVDVNRDVLGVHDLSDPYSGIFAARLTGPAQSFPSLGDINQDGIWDVVLVAGGELQAWSTGARGEALRTLWRSDIAASGTTPLLDTPQTYGSRVEARDRTRWLRPAEDPKAASGCTPADGSESSGVAFTLDPAQTGAALDPNEPSVAAEVSCRYHYGLNEGYLVIQSGSSWRRVPDAPWPVVGLACSGSNLLLKRADGAIWRMPVPLPWERHALLVLGVLVGAALVIGWLLTSKTAANTEPQPSKEGDVRRALLGDAPRTRRGEGHESQQRLLDGLLNVIDNRDTRPPVTVALYGPWGSGKSSVMQMLRTELRATERYIDVWFNAWRFQREAELAPALLQSIVDELGKRTNWVSRLAILWHRIRRAKAGEVAVVLVLLTAAVSLFAISFRSVSVHTGAPQSSDTAGTVLRSVVGALISMLALFAGAIDRVFSPWSKVFALEPAKLLASGDSKQRIRFVGAFTTEFEQVCKRLPYDTRLIVFIDDLDRCPPDRIVNVLETLSMLADTGSAFFVLAIDPVTVRRAIELTYKEMLSVTLKENEGEARNFGSRYLEKLITVGVHVPRFPSGDLAPERRLDVPAQDETESLLRSALFWFKERVLPGPPILVAIGLVALVATWAATDVAAVNFLLDRGASLFLSTPPPPVSASAVATTSDSNTPAPSALKAGEDPAPEGDPKLPGKESAWTPPKLQRASLEAPKRAPSLAQFAEDPPAATRWLSELVIYGEYALGALALSAAFLIYQAETRRRKRIENSRARLQDSRAFSDGLNASRAELSPNPRSVVRFTNLCRFLYPVVAGHPDAAKGGWQSAFFDGARRRWDAEPELALEPWLQKELDHWMGSPSGSSAATPSGPISSGPVATGALARAHSGEPPKAAGGKDG